MRKAKDKRRLARWGDPRVNRCSNGAICIKFMGNPPANQFFSVTINRRGQAYVNGVRLPPLTQKQDRHWEKRARWRELTEYERSKSYGAQSKWMLCVLCWFPHPPNACNHPLARKTN